MEDAYKKVVNLVPERDVVQKDGLLPEFDMAFISTDNQQQIYESFRQVIIAHHGTQISANQFVSRNMTLFAIKRVRGTAYDQ
jgi:hypothetical protein